MVNAYVLHNILYRETSLIVKFFTKEHGIVNLVARGAKRRKSQWSAILHPFAPLLIHWKQHTADLATLYQAEANGLSHRLAGIFLFGALYVNELILKLLAPMESYEGLFNCYSQFLVTITDVNKQDHITLEKYLRNMEKKIVKAIGYELQLDRESHSGSLIEPTGKYNFDFENGLQKFNPLALTQSPIFRGASLLALHNDNFTNADELREAKLFMRYVLANFLGGQSLGTKKLFT